MALSQEVQFKISGDTSQLNAAFKQSESLAEASGKKMEKAFARGVSGKGATRGLSVMEATRQDMRDEAAQKSANKAAAQQEALQEAAHRRRALQAANAGGPEGGGSADGGGASRAAMLGAAATIIGAIASVVTRFTEALNSRAKSLESSTGTQLSGLSATLGTIGGLQAQIDQIDKQIKHVARKDVVDVQLINQLEAKPQKDAGDAAFESSMTNPSFFGTFKDLFKTVWEDAKGVVVKATDVVSPGALTEAKDSHNANQTEAAALGNQSDLLRRELARQLKIYEAERDAIKELNDLQAAGIPTALELLDIESKKLEKLKAAEDAHGTAESQRAAQLHIERNRGQVAEASREANKATKTNEAEVANIYKVNAARQLGLASEVQLNRIELDRLKTLRDLENEHGSTASKRAAENAVTKQAGELTASKQRLAQHQLDVRQELAGQAAEGRQNSRGQTRPLSETERLARRAAQRRERARQGILTGAGGDADRLIKGAQADEESVGNRLSRASAGVGRRDVGDSTSIKPEIVRSNQLLESIKNALQPENVD